VAYRGGRRHVARLIRAGSAADDEPPRFAADAAYLVTGGLGRLGLRVARWMVERGARHLALMARSAPDESAEAIIRDLHARGAAVRVLRGDVADEEDLARCLREIAEAMPRLRGVIHAAGVTRMDPLARMTEQALRSVLHAKVAGAWNVHRQTCGADLDFFILFSSAAAIWGSRHMAHYAAANQFLDALAHYRRGLGLPALSVNFARLSERGMQSREMETSLAEIGVQAISVEAALHALGGLLRQGKAQATMALVDWATFKPIYT
jgi:nucleoside-diphosphate-sugar epimerase